MCGCCHRGIGVVQCFGHWCATWICLWCLVFGHDYPGMCTDCFEDFSDENLLCYDTSTVQILCNTAYVFSFNRSGLSIHVSAERFLCKCRCSFISLTCMWSMNLFIHFLILSIRVFGSRVGVGMSSSNFVWHDFSDASVRCLRNLVRDFIYSMDSDTSTVQFSYELKKKMVWDWIGFIWNLSFHTVNVDRNQFEFLWQEEFSTHVFCSSLPLTDDAPFCDML